MGTARDELQSSSFTGKSPDLASLIKIQRLTCEESSAHSISLEWFVRRLRRAWMRCGIYTTGSFPSGMSGYPLIFITCLFIPQISSPASRSYHEDFLHHKQRRPLALHAVHCVRVVARILAQHTLSMRIDLLAVVEEGYLVIAPRSSRTSHVAYGNSTSLIEFSQGIVPSCSPYDCN